MKRWAGSNITLALRAAVLLVAAPFLSSALCSGEGSSLPDLEPFTPEQEQRLHEIRDTAAEVRGLAVNDRTVEGSLSRETYQAYIDEQYAEIDDDDRAEFEAFNVALRLFHLIGPEDDVLDLTSEDTGNTVLGLYLYKENRLALIAESGAEILPHDEMILAHEYVHSFQDAAFDSEKLYGLAENDDGDSRTEYGTTVSCLKEGDATLSMVLYMEEVYGEHWRDAAYPDDGEDETQPEPTLPPALQRYDGFNYSECYRFVSMLYNDGGWDAVNAAYANPPSTTEHILHPDKYLKAEAPRSPAPASIEETLGDGWSLFDVSPFGEFDVFTYLATVLEDEAVAAIAAGGWGSGWTSLYVQDQEDLTGDPTVLVHLRLDWDSTSDYMEFMAAFGGAIETVSAGDWDLDQTELHWQNTDEYGYVTWNDDLHRVDVIVSSDAQPRDKAEGAQILRH